MSKIEERQATYYAEEASLFVGILKRAEIDYSIVRVEEDSYRFTYETDLETHNTLTERL